MLRVESSRGRSGNSRTRKLSRKGRNGPRECVVRDIAFEQDTSAIPPAKPPALPQFDEGSDEVRYQCTSCDMFVGASDSYCQFCGAIFSDGPMGHGASEEGPSSDEPPAVRPERFDLLSMMKPTQRSRELLYQEALNGFPGSSRLLEEIEYVLREVNSLGDDTSEARRLMEDAWDACRNGDWEMVFVLARQTEDLMAPSIPTLVRRELSKARTMLSEAKTAGVDISVYVTSAKSAMNELHNGHLDEALRLTKELMNLLGEDSVTWRDNSRRRAADMLGYPDL
jgi:hypothetical protein